MSIRMLLRDTLRKGYRARGRFLSLFGIIAISSAFFAGLKVTGKDMKDSAEDYYQQTGLMDLHLVSSLGFSREDLVEMAKREDIRQIYGGYTETAFMPVSEDAANEVVKIYSLPEDLLKGDEVINRPLLREGRMPENPGEALIEVNTPSVYQVGDTVKVQPDDEENSLLAETEFTIVGRVDWAMYTNFSRGTTTVGNGSIDSYLLVMPEAFDSESYTDVFLTWNCTKGVNSFHEEYSSLVSEQNDLLLEEKEKYSAHQIAALQEKAKSELDSAREELDDGKKSYDEGSSAFEEAKQKAEKEISDGEKKLSDGRKELDAQWERYHAAVADSQSAEETLQQKEEELAKQEQQLTPLVETVRAKLESVGRLEGVAAGYRNTAMVPPLPEDLQQTVDSAKEFDTAEFSLSDYLLSYLTAPVGSEQKTALEQAVTAYLHQVRENLTAQQNTLNSSAAELSAGKAALEQAKTELENGKAQLEASLNTLNEQEENLKTAQSELETSKSEWETTKEEKEQELLEAKQKLDDGEKDYQEALAEIEAIGENLEWFAFDRNDNPGFSSYGEDADRVDRIASVFPVFFILVAALVCLTTMTRMVEEQRTEIGTFKALGYSSGAVSVQFLLYAFAASVLGVGVGTVIGYQVFPRVIFLCYQMMYRYPQISCPYHWDYALGCLCVALLCTGITAMIACRATLKDEPAMLMRPKPPKQGKRILLERWNFVWKRISFHSKVTIRNFLRYRSRVLMTMLGICGCTALLVTGFGLYHAIAAIVDLQYEEVLLYDISGLYDETEEHHDILEQELSDCADVTGYQFGMMRSASATTGDESYEVTVMVPDDPAHFSDYAAMRDRKTHEAYSLEDSGVMINEKLARLLGVGVGDSVSLTEDGKTVPVTAIFENYAMNRVIMTPRCCEEVFGSYETNCFFALTAENTDEDKLAEQLLGTDALLRLEFTSQSGDNFRDLVQVLGYVVGVVILFSGLLALVVLYNLANINILERMRELATLKVLGFYDKEVSAYIFRENLLSSFLGMLAGLVGGIFLCRYVVRTAEVDVVMFAPDIPWTCFVLAAVLTMLFTLLVNLLLGKKVRAIDMAGSMKAIE